MTTICPACQEPPFRSTDFDSSNLGVDEASGLFGEVRIDACRTCGRRWLVYSMEIEAFPESGRWFRGEIDPDIEASLTPETALDALTGLEEYFAGGSYYRSTGHRMSGEIPGLTTRSGERKDVGMALRFEGGGPDDSGPIGVVARFMEATASGDTEAALALLTEESRQGTEPPSKTIEDAVVTFGEVSSEGELFIVPTVTKEGGESQEMDFVLREEAGEPRIDLDATMTRALGFDPSELMEGMGEAMAEGMGQMMEGMAEAMAEGLSAMGESMSEAVETPEGPVREEAPPPEGSRTRVWMLAEDSFPPEDILGVAMALCRNFGPDFSPEPEELDHEEWADETTQSVMTRYGNPEQGYSVVQSRTETEDHASVTVSLSPYGLPPGITLALTWTRALVPGIDPTTQISVMCGGPATVVEGVGSMLEENTTVLSVVDS